MGAIRGLISSAVRAAERFDEGQSGRRPSCCFISECQTAARVGSFSRRDCVRGLRSRRSQKITSAHDPEKWCLVFGPRSCATKKGRRSAERRMPSTLRTVPPRGEGVRKRSIADKLAQSAQLVYLRDRSPSGAPLRRLPRRANARTQPRPRFTRNTMRRRYLRLESRLSEAPRAPVVMPAGTMPGPPGSGVTSPARRNRTRSINWLSPVDVPDVSETARLWSSRRGSQRLCICADESGPFARRIFLEAACTALDSFPYPNRHGRTCSGHPRLASAIKKTWMPGIKPGMTGAAYFVITQLDPAIHAARTSAGPAGQARL